MKIAPLLTQYFYAARKLDFPGIGSFQLEGDPPGTNEKEEGSLSGVQFIGDRQVKESPQLIDYISKQTGKIRSLASADLESYWELAIQFLQIGKPFVIDGIGSLTKTKTGEYIFSPGTPLPEKLEAERTAADDKTGEENDYKSIFYLKKIQHGHWKRPLAIVLFIAGLGAAIWGGYRISKTESADPVISTNPAPAESELVSAIQDSSSLSTQIDSSLFSSPPTDSADFKYVVEKAQKKRALSRYQFLYQNGISAKLETADSIDFDIYFLVRSIPSDTARIRDSLARFYTPAGKQAYVKF